MSSQKYEEELKSIRHTGENIEKQFNDLKSENAELHKKISILSQNMDIIFQILQSKKELIVSDHKDDKVELKKSIQKPIVRDHKDDKIVLQKNIQKPIVSDYKFDKVELKERIKNIKHNGRIKAFTKGKENNFALGTNQGWIYTYSFGISSQNQLQPNSNQKQLKSNSNQQNNCDITYLSSYKGGEQLIVCSKNFPISVLNWNNLEILKQFNEHKEDINFVLDIGNNRLASGGNEKKIKIWEINQELKNIETIEVSDKNRLECRSMLKLTNHNGFIATFRSLAEAKLLYFDKDQNKERYKYKSKLEGVGTQFYGGLVEISEQRFAVASEKDTIVIVNVDKNKGIMTKEQEINDNSIYTGGTAFTFYKYKNNLFYASDGLFGKIKISEGNTFTPYCIMDRKGEFEGVLLFLFNNFCIADNDEQGLTIFTSS